MLDGLLLYRPESSLVFRKFSSILNFSIRHYSVFLLHSSIIQKLLFLCYHLLLPTLFLIPFCFMEKFKFLRPEFNLAKSGRTDQRFMFDAWQQALCSGLAIPLQNLGQALLTPRLSLIPFNPSPAYFTSPLSPFWSQIISLFLNSSNFIPQLILVVQDILDGQ